MKAYPERYCTGGPTHLLYKCGRPAAFVATASDGDEWFACEEHVVRARTSVPIADWFGQYYASLVFYELANGPEL